MPKLGMGEIRRRELIAATIATIHDEGFHDTTVARIARRAGLSTGIVHHYFRDKDDLLEATMRALGTSLGEEITARLAAARTPRDRIYAVIDGNFSATQFTRPAVIAWLAFWAQVPFSRRLARIQRVIYGRLRSNLVHAMRLIAPKDRAEPVVVGLIAHIDGLWLRSALDKDSIDPAQARSLARDYFDRLLPSSDPTKVRPGHDPIA